MLYYGFACGMTRPFLVEALESLLEHLSENDGKLGRRVVVNLAVLWNHTCFTTEQHVLHVLVHHDSILQELFCFLEERE